MSEGEWRDVRTSFPTAQQWYVALLVTSEVRFETKEVVTHVQLFRGYPGKAMPIDAQFWMALPSPPASVYRRGADL